MHFAPFIPVCIRGGRRGASIPDQGTPVSFHLPSHQFAIIAIIIIVIIIIIIIIIIITITIIIISSNRTHAEDSCLLQNPMLFHFSLSLPLFLSNILLLCFVFHFVVFAPCKPRQILL